MKSSKTNERTKNIRALFIGLALAGALAILMGPLPGRPGLGAQSVSYTWHDGDVARKVWVKPNLLARIVAPAKLTPGARAPGAPGTRGARGALIQIVPVTDAGARRALARSGRMPSSFQGDYSPVFSELKNGGGRLRALPGGVIAYLDSSMKEDAVRSWAAENKLRILSRIPVIGNVYLIDSAPGLASLILANHVRGLPGALQASPNWWVQVVRR